MRTVALAVVTCAACSFHPGSAGAPPGAGGAPQVDARAAGRDAALDAPPDAYVAPPVDAPPDAAPDAPLAWTVIETLTVSCRGGVVTSTTVLLPTVMYELHAKGECTMDDQSGSKGDAEYIGYNIQSPVDTIAGVDEGIAVNATTVGATKQPHWGSYTSTHDYTVPWTGSGAAITLQYFDANYSNNDGSIPVEILAYQ